jgi:hypothetical protein
MKHFRYIIILLIFFISIIPCNGTEKKLPDGYGSVKLLDSFEKVTSTYTNLIKIGTVGPFKSNLYALQLDDPYMKEVDFEFLQGRLVWICIRYKAVNGPWAKPEISGFGDYPFDAMEEKFIQEYGDPDDTKDGDKETGGMTTDIWKRWTWRNEKVVMEYEGKCHFSMTFQGAYIYTRNLYPKELEEKLKEIREKQEK